MNSLLYPKLAATNIKKNSKLYIPYILTCIITISMFYVIFELANNPGIKELPGATGVKILLDLGVGVMAILSTVFIFYTNSFLIKQRKKEFGLFNILGMEKRHIARILFFENLYVSFGSLVLGSFFGLLLNKLMFLLLLKILRFKVTMGFHFSSIALVGTIVLFSIIFILVLLNTVRQIYASKTIELIKGSNIGEKEPKNKWIITIIGIIALGTGYYISVTTTNPLAVVNLFFITVILVCIGVYCLFTSGSITVLKILRKNKNYYYKTNHFISISTMMYRMKQNAIGLANICILSTAVLVMVSSTIALYVGSEDMVNSRYPRDISISVSNASDKSINKVNTTVNNVLRSDNLKEKDLVNYKSKSTYIYVENDKFKVHNGKDYIGSGDLNNLIITTLDDYNRAMNEDKTLNDNEVFIYSNKKEYQNSSFNIEGRNFNIKEKLNECVSNGSEGANIFNTNYIVVKDNKIFDSLLKGHEVEYYYGFDLANKESENNVYERLKSDLSSVSKNDRINVESINEMRDALYSMVGGLFFLGIFLGSLFIMATILIMYYKQISEGYDDKERYDIMQKVGLSKKEIKSTINSQVLIVFFMPLIFAIINIAFAFPSITRLLAALNFTNTKLYCIYTVVTSLAFAICYGVVYFITAKLYYKIVK